MTRTHKLTLAATITTLVQIGSGGLVRATGSGDGCPDWPKCYGRWIPPLETHALIEYAHRLIASIAIISVLALAVHGIRRYRNEPRILWPSVLAGAMIVGLAIVGAVVVKSGLNETTVTLHVLMAMTLVGTLVYATVNAYCLDRFRRGKIKQPVDSRTAGLSVVAAASVAVLMLLGALVRGAGAALVFKDWPLMDGGLLPAFGSDAQVLHFGHRAWAVVSMACIGAFLVSAVRARPRDFAVVVFAGIAAGLFLVQSVIGAAQVWTELSAATVTLHVWLAALVWSALVAAFTVTRRLAACAVEPGGGRPASHERSPLETLRTYIQLTKPRIIVLLLVTTVPTMILAAGGMPGVWLIAATLFGGTLAAGSANAINCYVDRDIDSLMGRTRNRPLPLHHIEPAHALRFGIALGFAAFGWMVWQVNGLAAVLALAAILFYVLVYTLGLKRSTPQNIVIGGAAGAVPVLVGWAAVTGSLAAAPVLLFFVIYYWTPPHFWALAMRYEDDYEKARIPMLPVIASSGDTTKQILLYSVLLFAVTLLVYPVARMGTLYLVTAIGLGAAFVWQAVRLRRDRTPATAMGLFRYSITYLTLLFAAVAADVFVH